MEKKEYKVPRLLWESLEAVLLAQGKRYVRDMAKTLKVNEKELIKRVFPTKETLNITIHDTQTMSLQCSAYVPGVLNQLCRKPVELGSEFCLAHRTLRPTIIGEATLEKIVDEATRPSLWVQADGSVIDNRGQQSGIFNKNRNRLILFQIEKEGVSE